MATDRSDHYATLGVAPDADRGEIRRAYRRLARQLHPDHTLRARPDDGSAMAALNEAYRVLGDPGRRALYDAARRTGGSAAPMSAGGSARTSATPGSAGPGGLSPGPARVPWRLTLVMFGVGAVAVIVLAALADPTEPPPPDNLIDAGSCVVVERNGDAREVTCVGGDADTAGVRVVVALVASAPECPAATDAHRDRQGRGIACLAPPGATLPAG
ncbi:MAG: J domain-containing protein [Desertimonas sp.]